ncbi:MAG: aminotransferase class I/II-fold pyridoxal phosphate-dependent enzyme [Balneolaceae bacterium]
MKHLPIKPSERMQQLPEYLFGRLNAEKQRRRSNGIDIIDFGMGNPDMPTSAETVQKIHDVVEDEKAHRYARATGIPHLLKAAADHYMELYRIDLNPESEVVVTIGSKEGLSHLALALLGPGDRAVVPAPYFPIHYWSVVIAGGSVLNVPVTSDAEEFIEHLEDLKEKPKVLFLNFPHNPTGTTVDLPFFEEIVGWCRENAVFIIHDFAYKDITFGDYKAPSILQVEGAREIAVEFFTMSKSYNMAGWRCGFCIGNREAIALLSRIKSFFDYGLFTPIQVAAITALKNSQDNVRELAQKYEDRRDVLVDGLARYGWDIPLTRGAMYVWAPLPEKYKGMGSLEFSEWLLDEAEVLVSPGIGFGPAGEGHIRMSLVENTQRIRQAVRQIGRIFV